MQQYNDSPVSFAKIPWYTESEPSTWRTLRLCASVTSRRSRLPERFMQRSSKRRFLLRVQVAQTVEVDNGTGPENVAGENVTISIFVADFSISVPRHDRQISSTGSSISLPSFSPSFFFFLPWLHWPRHREYIDSAVSLWNCCHVPSSHHHWARIGHLLSFRARSSQIVANDSELPTDRLRKRMERRALNRLFAIVSFAKSRSPRE